MGRYFFQRVGVVCAERARLLKPLLHLNVLLEEDIVRGLMTGLRISVNVVEVTQECGDLSLREGVRISISVAGRKLGA